MVDNNKNLINIPKIKPYLKWAGGKMSLVDILKDHFPNDAKRYFEPFVGAGAVSLNVNYPHYIINDYNTDLYSVWTTLQKNGPKFIEQCKKLFTKVNNTKDQFYKLREKFNKTRDPALFVYLNRHCFNGLCRYNSKNIFNVPFGRYENPYFPNKEFENVLHKIKKFKFHNKDFRKIFTQIKEGDLVYCDPPYLPISPTASFSNYTGKGFTLKDQEDLALLANTYSKQGATIIISNHYTKISKKLYKEADIHKIKVKRTISSKTDKRNSVDEIIAIYNPK